MESAAHAIAMDLVASAGDFAVFVTGLRTATWLESMHKVHRGRILASLSEAQAEARQMCTRPPLIEIPKSLSPGHTRLGSVSRFWWIFDCFAILLACLGNRWKYMWNRAKCTYIFIFVGVSPGCLYISISSPVKPTPTTHVLCFRCRSASIVA
jgi:hypothetical protein